MRLRNFYIVTNMTLEDGTFISKTINDIDVALVFLRNLKEKGFVVER